jgi:hypothetical protein
LEEGTVKPQKNPAKASRSEIVRLKLNFYAQLFIAELYSLGSTVVAEVEASTPSGPGAVRCTVDWGAAEIYML